MSPWGRRPATFPVIEVRPPATLLGDDRRWGLSSPGLSTEAESVNLSAIGPEPASTAAKPRRYHCSVCTSAFARSEHLARHERSHRNERPFACRYCHVRFTRKDLIKRHVQRHHGDLPHASTTSSRPITAEEGPNSPEGSEIVVSATSPSDVSSPSTTTGNPPLQIAITTGQDPRNPSPLRQDSGQPMQISDTSGTLDMEAFVAMVFGEASSIPPVYPSGQHSRDLASSRQQNDIFDRQSPNILSYQLTLGTASGASYSPSGELQAPYLWGCFDISVPKRAKLIREMDEVLHFDCRESSVHIPSCVALEGCIRTFFTSFLCHMPCIHVPTWRAEDAHPSLILAMLSIGLVYQCRRELANTVHRAARLSIARYMESPTSSSILSPGWIMQTLFLIMAYGTWSGDPGLFQDALALQSRLAHIARSLIADGTLKAARSELSWEEWARLETLKRTIFMVYSYFNILNLSFNIPPALLNSEMDLPLPCTEKEWTAHTPETWAEYHKRSLQKPGATLPGVLQSLLSPAETPAFPSNAIGGHILLHAILQQVWHTRQASTNRPVELSTVETALKKWQAMYIACLESPLSSRSSHDPLIFNANSLLGLAYIRLVVDFSRVTAVSMSQTTNAISQTLKAHSWNVRRSDMDTTAAVYAIDALRIPIKLGLHPPTKGGTLPWSLQHHLFSFECCLFLSEWLDVLSVSGTAALTEHERSLVTLVQETLGDVGLDETRSSKPPKAQVMYAWTEIYGSHCPWGVISTINSLVISLADSLASQS
ncbi:hypothetical protein CONLIGDRAFT_45806 [Coniochaeta ligniaria NRRL 30616]|uniref:C2H2-type domain-containing protein n=1 Tax=Coniochaeta ligniaria NRRL 30616 TaxID=1408157 RepID=A0A1J7J752_9PEZI|nr:hypothetical protein CONLIGDRAFT_45806 [Coniochaeta ligniaria NRRL 30616]